MDIIEAIDNKIGEVRTESIDMSVGEIISLHQQKELVIQPDFQRLFRWSFVQRSRLVESLLLELPIPSIFLIERQDGVLELIDGLQRVSSLLHFISPESIDSSFTEIYDTEDAALDDFDVEQDALEPKKDTPSKPADPLTLQGCELVSELNELTFNNLPLTLKLRLKRTTIRTVVIKRQSSQFLRYEMFKRLNTGGAKLSDQDIRNVNARMMGSRGAEFYEKIQACSKRTSFKETTAKLSTKALKSRADEELVLRFFAALEFRKEYKGNVGDWLDNYLEKVLLENIKFGEEQISTFNRTFDILAEKFGQNAFLKFRGGDPIGGVAPAYFEAVTIGALNAIDNLSKLSKEEATGLLAKTVESTEFRKVTGPGANSLPKLEERIELIRKTFS